MTLQKECYWILHGVAVQNDVVGEGGRCNVRRSIHLTLLALSISIPRTVPFTLPKTFFIITDAGTESGMTIPHALPISTLQHFLTSRGTLVQHPEHFRLVSPRIPFPSLAHSRHTFLAHLV